MTGDAYCTFEEIVENAIDKASERDVPDVLCSALTDDCIGRGKTIKEGGAVYDFISGLQVGIANMADSLAAIKKLVYEEKKITKEQLWNAILDDFQSEENKKIQEMLINDVPKYGNDDDYADDIMKEVFEYYRSQVTGRPNMLGGMYRINMLPTTCHVYFGDVMMASPNGRLAHKPVSEGISPEKGADTNGPTAVVKSCAKMDHLQTGGTLLNQKFTPSVVAGEEGLDQMANLVRTYFNMDGHHIQFNVIDKETLIQAQKHPEDYKDLIVRVAGYSDHFRNLSKALQDEIIERTEQSFN